MAFAVAPPYMGVGFVAVWFALFVAFYAFERRSEREDEGTAALVLSGVTVVAAVVLIALMVAVAWATQNAVPIFG